MFFCIASTYNKKKSDIKSPCLALKGDIDILKSKAAASDFLDNENKKIAQYEAEIASERNSKYPNKDWIARRVETIAKIRKNIAIYLSQREQ